MTISDYIEKGAQIAPRHMTSRLLSRDRSTYEQCACIIGCAILGAAVEDIPVHSTQVVTKGQVFDFAYQHRLRKSRYNTRPHMDALKDALRAAAPTAIVQEAWPDIPNPSTNVPLDCALFRLNDMRRYTREQILTLLRKHNL